MTPRFPIGTVFTPRGKSGRTSQVVDIHTTFNLAGEVVKVRYVATSQFMGQTLKDSDVLETTIARGNPQLPDRSAEPCVICNQAIGGTHAPTCPCHVS